MRKTASSPFHLSLGRLVLLVLAAVTLYAVLTQVGDFRQSLHLLKRLELTPVLLAVASLLTSYFAAGATYYFLAWRRLPYRRTVLIQAAGMFVNRVLPAGIGSLGANYAYLRRQRHSGAQAASVLTVNNLLGITGHSLLVVVAILIYGGQAPGQTVHIPAVAIWLIGLLLAVIIIFAVFRFGKAVQKAFRAYLRQLAGYRTRPGSLLAAQISSITLTSLNIACLSACLQACGLSLPIVPIILVFSLSIGTGSAIPTPGGLGGVEAGLLTGLLAYNLPTPSAVAAVVLYRGLTYWLALLGGALAFAICQRRGYFRLI